MTTLEKKYIYRDSEITFSTDDRSLCYMYEDVKDAILKYRKDYLEKGVLSIEAYDLIFGEFN